MNILYNYIVVIKSKLRGKKISARPSLFFCHSVDRKQFFT